MVNESVLVPSTTSVPELSSAYHLSAQQVKSYQQDGHILLKGLASSQEIGFYRKHIVDAVNRMNTEKRAMHERDTYGKAFLQIFNLWRQNEILKKYVLARRFAKVAAQLMGVDAVRIYHDQALFKEPSGGHTPWHQDQFYWPLDTDNTITLWMPLVDLTTEMGIMRFASGSHKRGYILSKEISDASESFFQNYVLAYNLPVVGASAMNAGDATFHSGWTLHQAPPNNSDKMREVMTVIYYADQTRVLQPDNTYRENDLKTWLGGRKAGEIADSEMNPLVR